MLYLYLLHFYDRVIFYAERNQNLNAFLQVVSTSTISLQIMTLVKDKNA